MAPELKQPSRQYVVTLLEDLAATVFVLAVVGIPCMFYTLWQLAVWLTAPGYGWVGLIWGAVLCFAAFARLRWLTP